MNHVLLVMGVPRIKVINMPSRVWRISIDKIICACSCQCLTKIKYFKLPVSSIEYSFEIYDLIYNLSNISRTKSICFTTKWYIKIALLVKTHHPVKAGPVQKEKIKSIVSFVKPIAYFIVVLLPQLRELFPFIG